MQLMQQSSFDRLTPEIQQELIRLADQMDDRGFQYAQKSLEKEAELERDGIEDRSKGRTHILWVIGGVTVLTMGSGTLITCLLINASQYALAHTVMMSGFAVISALLGGAGLSTLLQKMTSGK